MIVSLCIGIGISLLMMILGISIPCTLSMLLLIPITFIGYLINPKYTCLAYVVPAIYLIDCILQLTGLKAKDSTPFLAYENFIILIGILHAIEGLLTVQYGANNSKEITNYNKINIAGGYQLDRRWYVPLLFFSIKDFYIPIIAVIAYTDETRTMKPVQKASKMGLIIKLYACTILGLGVLLKLDYIPLSLAMFFTPLFHELMFAINEQLEIYSPINTPPAQGLRIIATTKSPNFYNPFNKGDIIEYINSNPINTLQDYENILNTDTDDYIIEIQTLEGSYQTIHCNKTLLKRASNVFLPSPTTLYTQHIS